MTEKLKEELARIGDTVAPVYVAPDTWARGRRARRRDQLLAGAAVLALIATLGGLVGLVRSGTSSLEPAEPGESGVGALPSQVWSVPDHLTERGNDDEWTGPVETDLAVGRVSVAFVTRTGMPVLIGAADGRYHLMALDGWLDQSMLVHMSAKGGAALSISPDGTRLAYAWAGPIPASDAEPVPSGVRIVDLTTGVGRTVTVVGGRGVAVQNIVWSPDGQWLAWDGRAARYWTGSATNFAGVAAGRIGPGATATSEPAPVSTGSITGLAISNNAEVAFHNDGRWQVWDGHRLTDRRRLSALMGAAGSWSPDGSRIAIGLSAAIGEVRPRAGRPNPVQVHRFQTLDPGGPSVTPLGWVDATHLVAAAQGTDDSHSLGHIDLVLITAPTPERSTWTSTTIARSDLSYTPLTAAVDLVDLDHPTTDFPRPHWPWSTQRKVGVGTLTGLAIGLILYVVSIVTGRGGTARRIVRALLRSGVYAFSTSVLVWIGVGFLRVGGMRAVGIGSAVLLIPAVVTAAIGYDWWRKRKAWRLSRAGRRPESGSASPR